MLPELYQAKNKRQNSYRQPRSLPRSRERKKRFAHSPRVLYRADKQCNIFFEGFRRHDAWVSFKDVAFSVDQELFEVPSHTLEADHPIFFLLKILINLVGAGPIHVLFGQYGEGHVKIRFYVGLDLSSGHRLLLSELVARKCQYL